MNERIKQLAEQCNWQEIVIEDGEEWIHAHFDKQKFAELLLANLADELIAVATASKKVNPEWANGVTHAAMLAQRMTMNLPQWPDTE